MTKADKFKEIFGFEPNINACLTKRNCSMCPAEGYDPQGQNNCSENFWNSKYEAKTEPELKPMERDAIFNAAHKMGQAVQNQEWVRYIKTIMVELRNMPAHAKLIDSDECPDLYYAKDVEELLSEAVKEIVGVPINDIRHI